MTTGSVRCWGANGTGQLGHDSTSTIGDGQAGDASIQQAGDVPLGGTATSITAGGLHTCALMTTGAVRCWGWGAFGQLGYDSTSNVGDGRPGDSSILQAGDVPLGGTAVAITAGRVHTCALLTSGAVRCWGSGSNGQLGHDTTEAIGDGGAGHDSILTAGDIGLGGIATAVSAGSAHTCALLTTGAVRCWGSGTSGQLGHDNPESVGAGGTSILGAGDIPLGGKATSITTGASHSCALLTTGSTRCWGLGDAGQVGYNSKANVGDGPPDRSIEDAGDVPLGGTAAAITAGGEDTCALLTTGALRCWGLGDEGQLGHDNTASIGDAAGSSVKSAGDIPVGAAVRVRAATALTGRWAPRRDHNAPYVYHLAGHARPLLVIDPTDLCTGSVSVVVRKGKRTLARHVTSVGADCSYRARVRLTGRKLPVHTATRMSVRITFQGTGNLRAARILRHIVAH